MGTRKHKNRKKSTQDFERKTSDREPYDKVLIVTEGKKTEPLYFEGLKNCYRLNSTNIKVEDGRDGSSPGSVVNHGKKLYREERDTFDRVYFVFDKDSHLDYQEALDKIVRFTPKNTFFAINSVPCFEYWLLLHFKYTTSPFERTGNKSAAENVIVELKQYMKDYDKADPDIYVKLSNQLEEAKSNAALSLEAANMTETDNPTTRVHKLVAYLQKIKDS